jgi:hypothetical protein
MLSNKIISQSRYHIYFDFFSEPEEALFLRPNNKELLESLAARLQRLKEKQYFVVV